MLTELPVNRIKSLDYLRGLMAFAIMIYHYLGFIYNDVDPSSLLGKLGIYAVSIFYILSGLTLFLVYNNKINDLNSIKSFAIKRIFRIFPLLIFTIISTLIVRKELPDLYSLFINLTGIFGFVAPSNYIATGSWSIGNELFFYSTFPLLILLIKRSKLILFILSVFITLVLAWHFTNGMPNQKWWISYVNPLNQLHLFVSGIALGIVSQRFSIHKLFARFILIVCIILFIFFPVNNSDYSLVTGLNRIIFSILSITIVGAVFFSKIEAEGILNQFLEFLGEKSYTIYLLHPLVYNVIHAINIKFITIESLTQLLLSIFITFIIASFVFRFIEKPMIITGNRILQGRYFKNTSVNLSQIDAETAKTR